MDMVTGAFYHPTRGPSGTRCEYPQRLTARADPKNCFFFGGGGGTLDLSRRRQRSETPKALRGGVWAGD